MTNAATAGERSTTLDALRGLALFGVLVVNLVTSFRVSIFAQFLPDPPSGSGLDRALLAAIETALEMKAFSLFSFLFGVGLEAQRARVVARGTRFAPYIARRLGMLLVVGLAHLFLVWNGDVLTLYAVLGMMAAPLLALRTRPIVGLAVALLVAQVLPLPLPSSFPSNEALAAHVALASHVYPAGSFLTVLRFRIAEVAPIAALLVWVAPRVLALFLLGAAAWREGVFRRGVHLAPRLAVATLGLAALVVSAMVPAWSLRGIPQQLRLVIAPIVQALGYAALVLLVAERPLGARVLAVFAPLGRTALTSYLTQSFVLGAVFYGWGLGLFGRLAVAPACAMAVALYAAQLLASRWWLRRFAFGPFEWAWRSFTYGAWQRMRAFGQAR
ncbi:MAG: permease [Labilithrix sp.]|nr:permease [Labilithrix sp.]